MAMGLLGILVEALKIPLRNRKLALSIALLMIIPYSLLFLANISALKPLFVDLIRKNSCLHSKVHRSYEQSQLLAESIKDIRFIIREELMFIAAYQVLSLFSIIAAIYASAMTYVGKELTLKDLFLAIKGKWTKLVITWLYIAFFSICYWSIAMVLMGSLVLLHGSVTLIILGVILALAFLFSFYLSVIWMLGLVVSVVEENCHGIDVLLRASELIEGRKMQGFVLHVIISAVPQIISQILFIKMTDVAHTESTILLMCVAFISVTCLVSLYGDVVYTVLYYECKKSHGEDVEVKGAIGYSMLPVTAPAAAAIP